MEEVGVEAIVEGLSGFMSDMGSINGALDSLRPPASLLEQAFGAVGDGIASIGTHIMNVVETAMGVMLRDALEGIISLLHDVAASAIEAGTQFQTMEFRLRGINLQTMVDSGMAYDQAMESAIALTKEQLTWIMKIAAVTPFDATDIANVYTMARTYGFNDEEARKLTLSITDFTSAMGLSGVEADRVIVNLGQMVQRGKITTREMNDLARGSFVPLADILNRVAKNMGMTVGDLTQLIQTADGVPAEEFIRAFEEMTDSEVRFQGASERMAKTFQGATENVGQTLRDILGGYIVEPVLASLGTTIGGLMDSISNPENWAKLVDAASKIGKVLSDITAGLTATLPSGANLVGGIIDAFNALSGWLTVHKDDIINFFLSVANTIKNDIVPFVRDELVPAIGSFIGWIWDHREGILGFFSGIGDFVTTKVVPAFETISAWVDDHGVLIEEFFGAVGNIINTMFSNLTGNIPAITQGGLDGFLEGVRTFLQWVVDHQDDIAAWGTALTQIFGVVEVGQTVFNGLVNALLAVAGTILTIVTLVALFGSGIGEILALVAGLAILITELIMGWGQLGETINEIGFIVKWALQDAWNAVTNYMSAMWNTINNYLQAWFNSFGSYLNSIKDTVANYLSWIWGTIGNYMSAMRGTIEDWLVEWWHTFQAYVVAIWNTVVNTLANMINTIQSWSWWSVGRSMIAGMINGINDSVQWLINTVVSAIQNAYYSAMNWLWARSPSKRFSLLGEYSMEGMAEGITAFSDLVTRAMAEAMARVAAPAMALPALAQSYGTAAAAVSTSYQTVNNNNLNVYTNANSEPILADFAMLQSLS